MTRNLDEYEARRTHKRPDRFTCSLADSRALKVKGKPCRLCGATHRIEAHHVVHRSKIGSRNPYVHDPANIIPLCTTCHQHHHTHADRRVPRKALTSVELTFARRHANVGWLDLWYPTHGDDR